MREDPEGRRIGDDEAREIAKQLVRDAESPDGDSARSLSAQVRQLSDADEDRVEAALVDLGAVSPDSTTMAEREGGIGK